MHEFFEHTADLGIRVEAADLNGLFTEAAQALFEAIVEDPSSVRQTQTVAIALPEDDPEYLLFDWLKTLLYHFDAEHLLFSRFEAKLSTTGLVAQAWGEPLDRGRHRLEHEVKAITYHGLKLEKIPNGWRAEVIIDI